MRILVISQFFPPEMGAPAGRFYDFAKYWIAAGHEVSVVTSFPNFPTGVIPKQYRGKFYQKEVIEGIRVYRGYIYASPKLNFLSKTFGYISFVISSSVIILFAKLKYDIVISTSPPPMVGLPGIIASCLRRKPFVFDVRDIWPEGVVQSGRIKNRLLIRFLECIEMIIYRCSNLITVVTEGKRERLMERDVPLEKIEVISNGVDITLFDKEAAGDLPGELERIRQNSLCLTYAGVFNPSQGLDIILDCAAVLKEKAPTLYQKVAFVLIGDGSLRKHLEQRKVTEGLDRIHFMGIRSRAVVFSMLKRSYANLVTLRKRKDLHTVPSKIYEALASRRPIILSAEGEPASIVERANAGFVSGPGEVVTLSDNIAQCLADEHKANSYGTNAREYCEKHYNRCDTAAKFIAVLDKALNQY